MVKVTFTPTDGKDYSGTITITSDAESQPTVALSGTGVKSSTPSVATPEAVDLGLSVKWASFNLGATKPEEYGDYYAWGEVETYYSSLNPLTWKPGKEAGYDWPSYKWCMGTTNTRTKYCPDPAYGYNRFKDNKTVLDLDDDAAHVALGGKWRMPTFAEWDELLNYCTWTWIDQDGVKGRLATSKKNGNTIFLPSAGFRNPSYFVERGVQGYYWSASLDPGNANNAYYIFISSNWVVDEEWLHCYGMTIRAVSE